MRIITFILLLSGLQSIAQISPNEVGYNLDEINQLISSFRSTASEVHRRSNEFIEEEIPESDYIDSKSDDLQYLEENRSEVLAFIIEYTNEVQKVVDDISQDLPYTTVGAKNILTDYSLALQLYEAFKTDFDSSSTAFIREITENYGKSNLKKIYYNDLESSVWDGIWDVTALKTLENKTEKWWTFRDKLKHDDMLVIFDRYKDSFLYEKECSFMKKNKLDTLIGYYSDESINTFIVRNAKTGKYGLYDVNYQFEKKYTEVVFKTEWDSIKFDQSFGDYGNSIWTTAAAWEDGEATIKERVYSNLEDFDEGYETITYKSPVNNIWFPEMNSTTVGIAATRDEDGNFFYLDLKENIRLTPKYKEQNFFPLIINGEIRKDCYLKNGNGKIWYGSGYWRHEDENTIFKICFDDSSGTPTFYEDSARYIWFYNENGSIELIKTFKPGIGYVLKGFYNSGELKSEAENRDGNGEGFLREFYKDGKLKSKYGFMDGEKYGPFETYYPNGQLHEKGYYDTIYSSYGYDSHFSLIDEAYTSYFFDGNIKSNGTYDRGTKLNDWKYYNPFGKVNGDVSTEIKFPTRYIDTSQYIKVVENKDDHIALVKGNIRGYSSGMFWGWGGVDYVELWDTKNNRQLEPAIAMQLDPSGFYGENLIYGQSLEGDVCGQLWLGEQSNAEYVDSTIGTGFFPLRDPERINEKLAISYEMNKLCVYDHTTGQIVNSFGLSDTPYDHEIDYLLAQNKKEVYLTFDSAFYRLSIPELNIIDQRRLSSLNQKEGVLSQERILYNDAIIEYDNYYSKDSITNLVVKDIKNPSNQIKLNPNQNIYRFNYVNSFREHGYLFSIKEKKDHFLALNFDIKTKKYSWTELTQEDLDKGKFDPILNSPRRKLNFTKGNFENGSLRLLSADSVIADVNLKSGAVQLANQSVVGGELDSVEIDIYENQALYYLSTLQMSEDYTPDKEGYLNLLAIPNAKDEQDIFLTGSRMKRIVFQNEKKDSLIERFVLFDMNEDGDYLFMTPDQYYMGSKNLKDLVFFKRGEDYFEFEQFDLKYNRPDIILDRLGYADSALVDAYHAAYQKRLKKMGFTEDMLQDDFHLPEIKIENFEEMPTLHDQGSIDLKLKLEDSKYKLDRINVWVNDVAVYGADGVSLRDKSVQSYSTTLSVDLAKGNNKVQVSVLNQAGAESYKETFEIECTAGKDEPNLYLITIGESEFQQSDFNLTYAAKDAKDIAALFEKSKAYGEVKTKTLVNQEVTKENVIALKSFLAAADINDEVMIFIAGHGVLDANLDYFFATYDMDFQNPAEKGLAYEDLESLLDGIKPLKKTLMIDACHSGEIDKDEVELAQADINEGDNIQFRVVGNTATPKLGSQNTSELTKSLFTDLRKGTGATVISSAGGMEFAMEGDDWSNGLFTYCFIKGIQSKAADYDNNGEIWLSEIKRYVSEQVTELSNGKQQPTSRIENQVVDFRVW